MWKAKKSPFLGSSCISSSCPQFDLLGCFPSVDSPLQGLLVVEIYISLSRAPNSLQLGAWLCLSTIPLHPSIWSTWVWHCLFSRASSSCLSWMKPCGFWTARSLPPASALPLILTHPVQGLFSHPSLLSTCFSLLYGSRLSKNTHNLSRTNSHFPGQLV